MLGIKVSEWVVLVPRSNRWWYWLASKSTTTHRPRQDRYTPLTLTVITVTQALYVDGQQPSPSINQNDFELLSIQLLGICLWQATAVDMYVCGCYMLPFSCLILHHHDI